MFCGDCSIIGEKPGNVLAARVLRCKAWECEHCRPQRQKALKKLAASGDPNKLITLTVRPSSYESQEQAAQTLVHAWRMILQRGRREGRFGKIPYLAVFEDTKKGWPHLHIVARAPWIDQQWLSDRMAEYADSPIVDIRAVWNRKGAAYYVGKYISKGPGRYAGTKRYWRTQDWCEGWNSEKPVADPESLWWLSSLHLSNWRYWLEKHNGIRWIATEEDKIECDLSAAVDPEGRPPDVDHVRFLTRWTGRR